MTFKYRDHRELLADSMETVQEFDSREALIKYLQNSLDKYGAGKYDVDKIIIGKYGCGIDKRIGWDTHIVYLKGYGVFGFTDRSVWQSADLIHSGNVAEQKSTVCNQTE